MKPIIRIRQRTLEHVAGTSTYTDDRGRRWGIRTFTLRHIDYFNDIFQKAWWTYRGRLPVVLQHLAWALFIQRCLENHDPFLPLSVRVRRVMGMTDYSLRRVWRLSALRAVRDTDGSWIYALPVIADCIVYATLDKPTVADVFKRDERSAAESKAKPTNWGEIAASFFMHKNMVPDALLDLTIPMLNAIDESASKDSIRQSLDEQRRDGDGAVSQIAAHNRRRRG